MTSSGGERSVRPLDSQYLSGADAVELDAEARDIAARADLFFLDDDRGDDAVEHRIAERRAVAAVQFAVELSPALTLRLAPALGPRVIGIVAGDIDHDAAGQEIAAAVDRGDAAIAPADLSLDDADEQDRKKQAEKREPTIIARLTYGRDTQHGWKGSNGNHFSLCSALGAINFHLVIPAKAGISPVRPAATMRSRPSPG